MFVPEKRHQSDKNAISSSFFKEMNQLKWKAKIMYIFITEHNSNVFQLCKNSHFVGDIFQEWMEIACNLIMLLRNVTNSV